MLYASYDMNKVDILHRMRCCLARMSWQTYMLGSPELRQPPGSSRFTAADQRRIDEAQRSIVEWGITERFQVLGREDLGDFGAAAIINAARALKEQTDCRRVLIVVDYLQLLPVSDPKASSYAHHSEPSDLEWAGIIQKNSEAWQKRALAGLNILRQADMVDTNKLAAIGYCFGGATVVQLAYAGADLDGVVSFHSSLPVLEPDDAEKIKAKILVCHGVADGFIPAERIAAFQAALEKADADWQMIYYVGARSDISNALNRDPA